MSGKGSEAELMKKKSVGILTVREPVMMPNGQLYRYFWHDDWIMIQEAYVVKMGMRDTQGYERNFDMAASFPASSALGFAVCDDPPPDPRMTYIFGGSK